MSTRARRPDVTAEEKAAVLKAALKLYEEEGPRSVRGYAYKFSKLGERGELFLHGEPALDKNDDTIQRLLLELRQAELLPWDAVLDPHRRTVTTSSWPSPRAALDDLTAQYRQDIWAEQRHRVIMLSEKETLTEVVEPVTAEYLVPLTADEGLQFVGQVLGHRLRHRAYRQADDRRQRHPGPSA